MCNVKAGCIMDDLTCNEFKKMFEAEFGKCEFRAVSGDKIIITAGFVDSDNFKLMPVCIVLAKVVKHG